MEGSVHLEKNNDFGRICFSHPKGNSLPTALLKKLIDTFQTANEDNEIRVIILESEGNAFCAGASLSELKKVKNIEQGTDFFMGFAHLLNCLRKMSKFVLARVHGKVVGGGVGLVSACDYAFATAEAQIKLSELSIGLGPYIIEPAVSRKIGTTAFAQLSLNSVNWKSAQWCLEKGLYAEVVSDNTRLEEAINQKAKKLASYDPEACRELRKLHWKDTQDWETLLPKNAGITAQLALSDFTQNKIKLL
ncbi:MAG: enoyl-CoA hydratase [Flavobacteriaceae bacterium TMED212]|nr:MAG: enoyl-CoA hydratase [Flavobacteriaceae bacterium TMED212]